MKKILFILSLLCSKLFAQSPWPSESWTAAVNLTSVMSATGLTELSSLYWNNTANRLYVSHGDGRLRVLQLNTGTNTFSQIGNISIPGGPEGVTMVNNSANEFYTIDEDNYQIRKYTHPANYSSATLSRSWNISPSPMPNTGNTGPEGIAFVPDSFLTVNGFRSQVTGNLYTSVKGMGGLIFIAHQDSGYIWVFDVNPNVNNDFAYVGKYRTNKTESCDLAFDRTTGLLYILHNIGVNTIEATTLASTIVNGTQRKLITYNEYALSNPSGNINIEGFALSPKCSDSTNVSAFLCRDVESAEATSYKTDCIRWFNPFNAPGTCTPPAIALNLKLYIQAFYASGGKMRPVLKLQGVSNDTTVCDTVTIRFHQPASPYALAHSYKAVLKTNGTAQLILPAAFLNQSYYIAVKARNGVETWTDNPLLFSSSSITYQFSN